jgi:hypothetical protein
MGTGEACLAVAGTVLVLLDNKPFPVGTNPRTLQSALLWTRGRADSIGHMHLIQDVLSRVSICSEGRYPVYELELLAIHSICAHYAHIHVQIVL